MSEQYHLKYRTVWIAIVKVLLFFNSLFSLLSHHFILFFFSPLSFFLKHLYQPISSFTLFSSHCCYFSLFRSASLRHLMLISIAMGVFFFFFLAVIWWVGSTMGVFRWCRFLMSRHLMSIFVFFVVVFIFLWWWFWCFVVGVLVWDGSGVLMGGWVGGGWVSGSSGWVCGMWVGPWWLLAVGVGSGLWWGWLVFFFFFCIFIYCWFFLMLFDYLYILF